MESNVLTHVFEVFTAVITWMTESLGALTPVFWSASGGLTFIGVLACAGLAISVGLLVFNIVRGFLRFQ